jgi:hypothetical protein
MTGRTIPIPAGFSWKIPVRTAPIADNHPENCFLRKKVKKIQNSYCNRLDI